MRATQMEIITSFLPSPKGKNLLLWEQILSFKSREKGGKYFYDRVVSLEDVSIPLKTKWAMSNTKLPY